MGAHSFDWTVLWSHCRHCYLHYKRNIKVLRPVSTKQRITFDHFTKIFNNFRYKFQVFKLLIERERIGEIHTGFAFLFFYSFNTVCAFIAVFATAVEPLSSGSGHKHRSSHLSLQILIAAYYSQINIISTVFRPSHNLVNSLCVVCTCCNHFRVH